MSRSVYFNTSIAKKVWMALTGLFLCVFLIGHVAGNLQLMVPGDEGREQFNLYAEFMHHNIGIQILGRLTLLSLIIHAIDGLILTRQNQKARPKGYVKHKPETNSMWSSRNMGLLGTIILVFLVVHLQNFYWPFYYGRDTMPQFTTSQDIVLPDLYQVAYTMFSPTSDYGLPLVILYVISMAALGFHLWHGFKSGFQSLGIHPRNRAILTKTGYGFAVIISILFAIIPVYIYLVQ